jgi:hypothetical protein
MGVAGLLKAMWGEFLKGLANLIESMAAGAVVAAAWYGIWYLIQRGSGVDMPAILGVDVFGNYLHALGAAAVISYLKKA